MARPWPLGGRAPRLRAVLARWLYPYALAAALTFLLGAAAGGVAAAVTPTDALAAAAGSVGTADPFPDRLTPWTVFANNVVVAALVAAGAVTFGLAAGAVLFFNGFLIGVLVAVSAGGGRLPVVLALLLPHGILELGAFFVVGGVAYRISWRLASYLRGVDARPLTRREAIETAALLLASVAAIAVAAWIEAALTVEIARAILGPEAVGP